MMDNLIELIEEFGQLSVSVRSLARALKDFSWYESGYPGATLPARRRHIWIVDRVDPRAWKRRCVTNDRFWIRAGNKSLTL